MKYKVGICQFQPLFLELDTNLDKMESLLTGEEADLIVLPELATSGYLFKSLEEVNKASEDAFNGKTSQLFLKLAEKNNTSYVIGIAEKYGENYYNSSILVNPDRSIHLYRKTHLFYKEKIWFAPGDTGFQVFPAKNGVKIGLMVCFDWIFPESARTLALKGSQIIAHSANLVLPWCQQAMITRSLENRVFSITCNRTGKEINGDKELTFTGMSQILDTKGNILTRLDQQEEKITILEIETDDALNKNVTENNHLFRDRRLEYYEET
ncbi:nitrilase-related carbon-nitrogen hydrolase [Candidatus Cloacimonadota bacterium]